MNVPCDGIRHVLQLRRDEEQEDGAKRSDSRLRSILRRPAMLDREAQANKKDGGACTKCKMRNAGRAAAGELS